MRCITSDPRSWLVLLLAAAASQRGHGTPSPIHRTDAVDPPGRDARHLGLGGGPRGRRQQRRRAPAQVQGHPGDDPARRRRRAAAGPDDPVGGAPSAEGRRRAALAGDGQQRRGGVVRGDGQRLRGRAGRRDVPPSPASRPPLVDRRRRPLPRDPGERRHDLADGRRLGARSRRLAGRAGRPQGRRGPGGGPELTGSSCSTTPARSGPARASRSPSGSSPTASPTAGNRTGRAPLISRSSRARGSPAALGADRTCASSRRPPSCRPARRSFSWVTPPDAGPAGTLGFFAELGGRALPRELIPMAAAPGARVEMHLRDLKLAPGSIGTLSIRAVDAAGNLGPAATADIRVSDRLPAPLPGPSTGPGSRRDREGPASPGIDRGRHPRRAGQGPPGHAAS